MVFSSHLFVYYFLPLALAAYFLAPRRVQNLVLTLFSFVFYGWANVAFILAADDLDPDRLFLRPGI